MAVLEQALQELNLAGVIEVVRGDAGEQREVADLAPARRLREIGGRELRDGGAKVSMGAFEKRDVLAPGSVVEPLARDRTSSIPSAQTTRAARR